MSQNTICEFYTLIEDIQDAYTALRRSGSSREVAVAKIRTDYAEELNDRDDRAGVLLGIAFALCRKNELTAEIAQEVRDACAVILRDMDMQELWQPLQSALKRLDDPKKYGSPAQYRAKKQYIPDWEIGDTFAHTLTCPMAEKVGIAGKIVLLRKVGAYTHPREGLTQILYATVCDTLPQTTQELDALGFLPMMCRGKCYDYFAQIHLKNAKDEAFYGLTKIGCFPDAGAPKDQSQENPLTTMPFFGRLRKDDTFPDYEDLVCRLYQKFQIRSGEA